MLSNTPPASSASNGSGDPAPADVVRRFLLLLEDGHLDAAMELLDEDVEYINVSLPTMRGRERARRALSMAFGRPKAGFEVYFHAISASEGGTVLTERTDVLIYGPIRVQLWVCGRFDVADGKIVLWKDYFDWLNVAVSTVRGLIGAMVPFVRPKPPAA
jgi:limonene-1,2-epoxide hydrolase